MGGGVTFADTTLFLDSETLSADLLHTTPPREFVRLFQFSFGEDPEIHLTSDYDEMIEVVSSANRLVGHNVSYDLTALFGNASMEPLHMAMRGQVLDTFVYASLVNPAPYMYTNRVGRTIYDAAKPERAMSWLSLAEQCHQLGIEGKHGDLKELAKKYNPPKTKVADLDYGLIPLDDPDFREYARQDVVALRELTRALFTRFGKPNDYAWREMKVAAINAQISRNGFTVDTGAAQARVDELAVRRQAILSDISERYGLPTEGKSPWATTAGKDAIFKALAEYDITPKTRTWPETATGNPSLSGEALISLTQGTEAEELGVALAELKGQRSLAQLALDSTHSDGKVHPDITTLQRSGRTSVTKPGLTVWGSHEGRAIDKAYFVASPGRSICEFDFSSADARAVAAVSGDENFAKRFAPGAPKAGEINGRIAFGDAYEKDKHYQISKAGGHLWSYRGRGKRLSVTLGIDFDQAKNFIDSMDAAYPRVVAWQNKVTAEGESGWVTNSWGRRMRVDVDRSFTMSSGLIGQSTTREMLYDGLMRMYDRDPRILTWIVALIHDAVIADIENDCLDWGVDAVQECMEATFHPKGGIPILFEVSAGQPSPNWMLANHD